MATLKALQESFGNRFLTMVEIKQIYGVKDARTVKPTLVGLPCYRIGGRVKWWGGDIAKRLDASKIQTL